MPLTSEQLFALRASEAGDSGNRLATAVELSGLTQGSVASTLGLSQSYLSDVIRGRYAGISLANARRLSEFFGCRIEDLFPSPDAESVSPVTDVERRKAERREDERRDAERREAERRDEDRRASERRTSEGA